MLPYAITNEFRLMRNVFEAQRRLIFLPFASQFIRHICEMGMQAREAVSYTELWHFNGITERANEEG
jgi:hypothetical protein